MEKKIVHAAGIARYANHLPSIMPSPVEAANNLVTVIRMSG
jgi:hypothetical protein